MQIPKSKIINYPIYFFILKDPLTNEICYVGLTTIPDYAYRAICSTREKSTNPCIENWINDLFERGLTPIFEIWESFDENTSEYFQPLREKLKIIRMFLNNGAPLFNTRSNDKNREKRIKSSKYWKRIEKEWDTALPGWQG